MKVEDIKNDDDVVKFMRVNNLLKKYGNQLEFCKDSSSFLDSTIWHGQNHISGKKNWFTIDINDDKKLDLLFCSCIDGFPTATLFLSFGESIYKRFTITRQFTYSRLFAYAHAHNTLVVGGTKPIFDSVFEVYRGNSLSSDTIAFVKGKLMEFNSQKTIKKIDSIRVSVYGGFPLSTRQNTIIISKNVNIKWRIEKKENESWIERKYILPNSIKTANAILAIAENLPYYKYTDQYLSTDEIPDGAVWYTDIYFSNGTKIEISDESATGPFGLQLLYNEIDSINNIKKWKQIFVEKDRN